MEAPARPPSQTSPLTSSQTPAQTPWQTRIKLCGLMRESDIRQVNRLLPEYAGFILAPSRRRVSPEYAGRLVALLDERIRPVGVFVDESITGVIAAVVCAGLRAVQLHGGEDKAYVEQLRAALPRGVEIWKAFRMKGPETVLQVQQAHADGLADRMLLDAWHPVQAGGAGAVFDWTLLENLSVPYLLAGGLNVENVAHAVTALRPWGVDVSSGVETDGYKDEQKLRAFVTAVRQADTYRIQTGHTREPSGRKINGSS